MVKRCINFTSCLLCIALGAEVKSLVVIYMSLIGSILGYVFRFMAVSPSVQLQLERIKTFFLKCMYAHQDMLVSCLDQRSLFRAEPGITQMCSNVPWFKTCMYSYLLVLIWKMASKTKLPVVPHQLLHHSYLKPRPLSGFIETDQGCASPHTQWHIFKVYSPALELSTWNQ